MQSINIESINKRAGKDIISQTAKPGISNRENILRKIGALLNVQQLANYK